MMDNRRTCNELFLRALAMDNRRTCNELFLRAVANEYTVDYKKLKMGVSYVFTREEQEDIDPDGDYLHSTEHFGIFVKEHEIKEANVGTVVLYLKVVKMAVSHQELVDDLDETEDVPERQNVKRNFACFVLYATGLVLSGLSFLL